MAKTSVTLGPKAQVFSDPATGIYIKKGQVVELSVDQLRTSRIQKAFQGGHLVVADVANKVVAASQAINQPAELPLDKFKRLLESGATDKKLEKAFSLDNLKKVAQALDLEPEEGDTKETLIAAIKEELQAEPEE